MNRHAAFCLAPLLAALAACDAPPEAKPAAPVPAPEARASAPAEPAAADPAPAASAPATPPAPPDVAAPPADAEKTPSGLASKILEKGKGGEHPGDTDTVEVHYTGWTKAGRAFDSSIPRGEPSSFGVTQVIPGWTEGLKLMTVGEKRRFWIPAKLAYGERPAMPGAPAGDLVFDVELLSIKAGPKPPPVPEDVKAPPKSAQKTKSGLAYRVIKKGNGKVSPKATDKVRVHYTGWTTDGKMFDSSVVRGEPTGFRLNQVIPGWTEGLQLMKVGDVFRFWIPGELAYGDKPKRPGAPAGMLVFDVELLAVD